MEVQEVNVKKTKVEWEEIHSLVEKLAQKIESSKIQIKDIFGLQRGGLIPAVMLSHRLDIPMTQKIISPSTLIVDDICDSGATLHYMFRKYQNRYDFSFDLQTACLHYKPHTSMFVPTLYAEEWKKDDWIIYPWERDDSKAIQDYKL